MKDIGIYSTEQFILNSSENQLITFNIKITPLDGEALPCVFDITCNDLAAGKEAICQYHLKDREHHSYLDFFEELSLQLGLRIPQNRQKNQIRTAVEMPYKEVLVENLNPGILYGYGDPAVIKVDQNSETQYYLLATSNDAPDSFPIFRSKNLIDWEFVNFVFPKGEKPEWATDGEYISD